MREIQSCRLRIMTFNVWRGGIQVGLGQIAEAIRAAAPDLVGLQESEGNTRGLADRLGWPYADEGLHLISRFPLFRAAGEADPDRIGRYGDQSVALVEVRPGAVAALANLHLTPFPAGREDDAEIDRRRRDELQAHIARLRSFAEASMPAFLIGDFNGASHLDLPQSANREKSLLPATSRAGFRDSYRETHPDPIRHPGITWSPGCPHPRPYPGLVPERIDFILSAGPCRVLSSRVVGETGGPDVEIGLLPWPSDHRAVVSDFELEPAFPGNAVTVERSAVAQGNPVTIRYLSAADDDGKRIGIQDRGGRIVSAMAIGDGSDRRALAFGTASLEPGAHDAVLLAKDGAVTAARRFWVLDRAAAPELHLDRAEIAPGAALAAAWRHAPVDRYDWLGVFRAGEIDPENYLAHLYTGGTAFGATSLSCTDLPSGDYELRLMRDDAYVALATAPFRIR
jgi:endonuclease/exonuclease/phosphatase family metal-dependent hydrolase